MFHVLVSSVVAVHLLINEVWLLNIGVSPELALKSKRKQWYNYKIGKGRLLTGCNLEVKDQITHYNKWASMLDAEPQTSARRNSLRHE